MQRRFVGFDSGATDERERRLTGVPGSFFTQLLPQITNPNELKTLLYFMYLAGQKRGEPKWVGYWELAESEDFVAGLRRATDPRSGVEHLRESLEMCMARGTIVRVVAAPPPPDFFGNVPVKGDLEPVSVTWFLLNTAGNRDFLASLERGDVQIEETSLLQGVDLWDRPLPLPEAQPNAPKSATLEEIRQWRQQRWHLRSSRPDIYTLYEQNIGSLTPLLSEKLREAEKLYPAEWIEDAFKEAVNYNRRSWAYIARILENWLTDGREEQTRPRNNQDSYRTGRAGVAGNGKNSATKSTESKFSPEGRPAASNRSGGPIDFAKYTTGKYAYLTQPRPEDAE